MRPRYQFSRARFGSKQGDLLQLVDKGSTEASIVDSVTFLRQSSSPEMFSNHSDPIWSVFRHQIHFQDWNWSESEQNRGNVSSKRSQNRVMDGTWIDFWWWFWQAGDFLTQKYMFGLPRMYFGDNFGAPGLVRTSSTFFTKKNRKILRQPSSVPVTTPKMLKFRFAKKISAFMILELTALKFWTVSNKIVRAMTNFSWKTDVTLIFLGGSSYSIFYIDIDHPPCFRTS